MFLDMMLTNAHENITNIKTRSSLGYNNHALVEFVISWQRVRTLNFRIANFKLFKKLFYEISWETVLRDKEMDQSQLLLNNDLLRAQELFVHQNKKVGRGSSKPAWLSKDLLGKLHEKKGMYK